MIAESSHGAFRWDGDTALYVSKEYKRIAGLYIENITGDITVYASAAEKAVVSSLNVKSVSFNICC